MSILHAIRSINKDLMMERDDYLYEHWLDDLSSYIKRYGFKEIERVIGDVPVENRPGAPRWFDQYYDTMTATGYVYNPTEKDFIKMFNNDNTSMPNLPKNSNFLGGYGSLALGLGGLLGDWISKGVERDDQKKELAYQHDLQKQIFDREDTSYQRAVADIKASGLGLSALSGGANSGAVISTRPVESNQFQALGNIVSIMQSLTGIKNMNLQNQLLIQDQIIKKQIMEKNNRQILGLDLENDYQALLNQLKGKDLDYYTYNAVFKWLSPLFKVLGGAFTR